MGIIFTKIFAHDSWFYWDLRELTSHSSILSLLQYVSPCAAPFLQQANCESRTRPERCPERAMQWYGKLRYWRFGERLWIRPTFMSSKSGLRKKFLLKISSFHFFLYSPFRIGSLIKKLLVILLLTFHPSPQSHVFFIITLQ